MDPLFQVHRLNPGGQAKAEFVADAFEDCLAKLSTHVPASREFSIVKTKLEEACFFAKKAIANDPANQLANDPSADQTQRWPPRS
jgi:hypothetical protein